MACTTHEFNKIAVFVKHGVNFKREWRWKCDHPDCMASFKRHQVKGKRTVCCVCHKNELILDADALKRAKPRCQFCSQTKENIEKREAITPVREFLDDILDEIKIPEPKSKYESDSFLPTIREVEEREENDILSGMYRDD